MAISNSQIKALKVLQAKARDGKDRPFVDGDGNDNLVARVRRTRKGKKLGVVTHGAKTESAGKNGSSYYVIRRAATDHGTGLHLYCSCPAQRFKAKYGNPCKHTSLLLAQAPAMLEAGINESMKRDIILYDVAALSEALSWNEQDNEAEVA